VPASPAPAGARIALTQLAQGLSTAAGGMVWRGDDLLQPAGSVQPSGHDALDAQLPGGGWPLDALIELLPGAGSPAIWPLVLPALARQLTPAASARAGVACVVLVNPPHAPFLPALAAQGLPPERLLCLRAATPRLQLWAAEQALRCADVVAVLAWLPQARDEALRRLQLMGNDRNRLLFVMRPAEAGAHGSPARLRLRLDATDTGLQVHLLKRRGPPLAHTLATPAHAARLEALLAARRPVAGPSAAREEGARPPSPAPRPMPVVHHALDRPAAA
jgi:protein ImuA